MSAGDADPRPRLRAIVLRAAVPARRDPLLPPDSAVRAVYQCQPYALPSEKYALWRDMILNFDPSDMYRAG